MLYFFFIDFCCFCYVHVLKPSHKSTLQSKMIETPVPDTTNATRDAESEFDAGQEGKIREIVMDNVESESVVCNLAINSFFGLY
jgi:hypothetical protein